MSTPARPRLEDRPKEAHKGDFGRALLIGGSRGMAGAIAMAGMAAVRSGAGTVTLCVPEPCLETVASFSPCLMTLPLAASQGKLTLEDLSHPGLVAKLSQASCIAVGPGIGQSAELQRGQLELLAALTCPAVIDADGLNNLAAGGDMSWCRHSGQPLVITPHPGEWSRLTGVAVSDSAGQASAAIEWAEKYNLTIVLKGHQTLITDGRTAVRNDTGTPAMATGGSGDVLTGMITALVCQGLAPRDAAHLAVWVHGKAAELASERLHASHVVLPTDLIDSLPAAFAAARETSPGTMGH
jgi:ADP-dependent NAD(P)H-hydrate dehydratase